LEPLQAAGLCLLRLVPAWPPLPRGGSGAPAVRPLLRYRGSRQTSVISDSGIRPLSNRNITLKSVMSPRIATEFLQLPLQRCLLKKTCGEGTVRRQARRGFRDRLGRSGVVAQSHVWRALAAPARPRGNCSRYARTWTYAPHPRHFPVKNENFLHCRGMTAKAIQAAWPRSLGRSGRSAPALGAGPMCRPAAPVLAQRRHAAARASRRSRASALHGCGGAGFSCRRAGPRPG